MPFNEGGEEQFKSLRITFLPRDLANKPNASDLKINMQIVIKSNDQARIVIIEAYEKPIEKLLLVTERKVGK